MPAFTFHVFGKVQGVFFRKHCADTATRLGLQGWVQNEADGSVSGLAVCATEPPLAELRAWLARGSPKARVDRVDIAVAPAPAPAVGASFEVRR